jgi:peptide deformylase
MALLPILRFPDARLQRAARPVQAVDARIRQLAADMLETMYEAKGIGLAATQVNVHEQVIVIDTSEERNAPQVLINPQLLWASDERVKGDEGCLSVPGWRGDVLRYRDIDIEYTSLKTLKDTVERVQGFSAVIFQHECDHLDGVLYIDKTVEGSLHQE